MIGQYATLLVELLLAMKREVCLEYEDIALIVLQLNSDEKILEFIDWVKARCRESVFRRPAQKY